MRRLPHATPSLIAMRWVSPLALVVALLNSMHLQGLQCSVGLSQRACPAIPSCFLALSVALCRVCLSARLAL